MHPVPRMRNDDITLRDFADATYNTDVRRLAPAFASLSLSEHVIPAGLITAVGSRSYITVAVMLAVVNAKSKVRFSKYGLIKSVLEKLWLSSNLENFNQSKLLINNEQLSNNKHREETIKFFSKNGATNKNTWDLCIEETKVFFARAFIDCWRLI